MSAEPIKVGLFAPYPVWLGVALTARSAQLFFLGFCIWYLVALFDAMDKAWTISAPPMELWFASAVLGVNFGRKTWRGKTSPVGEIIGNILAAQQCPSCGQNIFDPTSGTGYASLLDRQAILPSRFCANCGHDLTDKTAPFQ